MSSLVQGLAQVLLLVLAVVLRLWFPAAGAEGTDSLAASAYAHGRDPSYALYQKYRYAYESYGYLFLHEENSGADEAGVVQAGAWTASGNVAGLQDASGTVSGMAAGAGEAAGPGTVAEAPALAQLQDYDYLMKTFYSVHASTTAGRDVMRAEALLGTDLHLEQDSTVPQILIYHTHSQETYADYGPSRQDANVVTVGEYLAGLLRQKGWNVIHDTGQYDIQGGKLDRNRAYNYALEGISTALQQNPTVQVVLDIHRDGVSEKTHLVHEVNGRQTANIMFFQGMSRTPEGPIEYLPNPYLNENLAFSFQMQYLAASYYPGFTRKIYLKGLRYNLHLRPRSSLIEVGAQTNTLEEALNAMEPLAELLDMVLQGK